MTDPTDDEDELNGKASKRTGEGESKGGKTGKSGSSGGGAKFSSRESDEAETRRKKGDEGEGDQDSWGRGKAGAGSAVRITPQKLKGVMADWRYLDITAVVEAVTEFFSDLPMRASANLSVAWEKTKSNVKSFAIVNWLIAYGRKTAELAKTRERSRARGAGRDSRGLQRRRPKTNPGMNMAPGPAGPTGQ
ncbi:MAG: hypothetical protein P4M13_08540 [Alphaproteobacteria bacterium]|nr:hypothetical protein [Alphaproteobacteria bacterium]